MEVLSVITTIDWITLITEENYPTRVLNDVFNDILEEGRADAEKVYPCHIGPYEGIRIKGCSWAMNGDAVLLSIPGEMAHENIELVDGLKDVRVTRLDIAVTVLLGQASRLGGDAYVRLCSPNTKRRYKTKATLIYGSDKGCTVYVGSRAGKNSFGRLYDKGIQSKETDEDGIVWRYEVQLKGGAAQNAYDTFDLQRLPLDDLTSAVHQWFTERGVEPVFSPTSSKANFQRDKVQSSGNVDKKLKWLERSVRPVITELRLAGYSDKVYNGLGLKSSSTSEVKEGS